MDDVKREILPDGTRWSAPGCSFRFQRLRPGALVVVIEGQDRGQFGTATLDEIRMELERHAPLELFVDARAAEGADVRVSEEWTRFFQSQRERLVRVHVLVRSKIVALTVKIAQHLSRTGDLMQILTDAGEFDRRVAAASTRT